MYTTIFILFIQQYLAVRKPTVFKAQQFSFQTLVEHSYFSFAAEIKNKFEF